MIIFIREALRPGNRRDLTMLSVRTSNRHQQHQLNLVPSTQAAPALTHQLLRQRSSYMTPVHACSHRRTIMLSRMLGLLSIIAGKGACHQRSRRSCHVSPSTESSSSYQTTDGADAVELSARPEDLNNTDQVPLADELYVAAEEQVTSEIPSVAAAPTTAEQPTAAEEPATAEVPTTADAPTEVEPPTEAEASTRAEAPVAAEEPIGAEERTAAEEWTAAEQQTTADDNSFDSISAKQSDNVSAKPSSIPIVAGEAWASSTPRSDDHMRWESVLRDTGLDDAGNAGRERLAQGELAPQAISSIDEKPSVAERSQATEPNTFERDVDQDDAQSQEYGDGPLSATSETAAFADFPSERNDPDLAKAFFDVDVERAVAMARSELGLRDAGLGGGDSDPTEVFFAVDIERAILTVCDELGEVATRADSRGADGAADTSDPRAEVVSTNMDRTLRTMLRELKKKPE